MYTVLNSDFQVKGSLTLNNGRGSTAFFADTITQQIATDDSNSPDTLLSNSFNDYDKQGNTKQWNHTLTLSVEATNLGTSITTSDYIMYFDEVAKKYYMMKVIDTATDRNSGFITVDCINTAIYELGKQLVVEEKTFQNATLSQVVESVYKNAPFSVVIQDDLTISIDYTISANTSLQAVVQDLQTKYNVDVDSWITLDNDGQIGERVLYFGHLGSDNGELIRYGGGKGFENINAQELSDIIYTKVYVTGVTSDTDTTKGHIGSVNNGLEYIVDDDANQRMYAVGASQQQPVYLEGQLTNNILSEPSALLDWGKQQLALFNHPRFNYTVTPLHDEVVGIGDSITVQDFHIQPMILVTSKVIQKSTSFASPETNTFVLGEFSSIFSDRTSKNNMVIEVIKKDVTVVQEAADYAKAQADEAHQQAVLAQEQAIHAQTSADGKTTTYTVDDFQDLPGNAVEGDLGWVKTSDGTVMYIYTKKADGTFAWVENVNPHIKEDIANAVDTSVKTAKEYTDDAIKTNNTDINNTINEVSQEKIDATLADADFNAKAQSMADKALADAKANTATVAQDTLNSANDNIADAKKSLTDDLNKEVSDRTKAVSDLDTTAQGYADKAKTDAINAATTADGVINKKIDDTASSITTTINQNKTDADDKITTAQSTATQALNQVSTKVSQTDYDKKTGQLQTDLTSTTQTANKATTDIVSIQQKDNTQDARMTQIESDASGVKTTVSDLQTAQGKQTGDISTLQQRADGFDATVTKVDNLSTGDRNYILDTANPKTQTSNGKDSQDLYNQALFYSPIKNWGVENGDYIISFDWTLKTALSSDMQSSVFFNQSPWQQQNFTVKSGQLTGHVDLKFKLNPGILTATQDVTSLTFRIMSQMTSGNTITYSNLFMKSGTIITTWTPAPEDLSGATAKAQLTADNAALNLSKYQTDADGRISKAQSGVEANANAITQKVSQTDYDKKTGDLDTRVTKAQQTADGAVTTVGNYKTSNDARVKATETSIAQNAKDITLRATTADLNSAKSDYNAQIAQVKVDAGKVETTVSNLSDTVNNLSVGGRNYFLNSSGSSLEGWSQTDGWSIVTGTYRGSVLSIKPTSAWTGGNHNSLYKTGLAIPSGTEVTVSFWAKADIAGAKFHSEPNGSYASYNPVLTTDWARYSYTFTLTSTTIYFMGVDAGKTYYLDDIKIEIGNVATDWTPAPEDTINVLASQQVTIDGITDTVSKQGTNIDSVTQRVTNAEGTLTTATNNITGLQTKQTTTANQVTQEISDRKTGDNNTLQSSKDFTTSSITSAVNGVNSTITQTASGILAQVEATNMVVNSEFDPLNGTWYQLVGSGAVNSTVGTAWSPSATLSFSDWAVVDGSTLLTYAVGTWFTTALAPAGAGRAYSASIIAGRPSAVTTSTALDLRIGFWDANKKLLSNASSGNIIDGTAYKGIDKYKVENKVAPANTKYVSVIIAHSSASATDIIGRPMLNNGTTVSPYVATFGNTSSSTILSLFKDNWSIGIANNIGAITSGIVGDTNSISLINKHIILDSENTTVTGDFYALGGNFKNLNASNMTVGTLNGNQVNITNVNVSNLVGDTITGFNFNINKSMFIAPGGTITSGVMSMTNDGFSIVAQAGGFSVTANNIAASRQSPQGYKVTGYGTYHIDSSLGLSGGDGTIQVFNPGDTSGTPYKTGAFHSEYGLNNLLIKTNNYSNGDLDEYLNISSASFDLYNMDKNSNITRSVNFSHGSGTFSNSMTVPTIYATTVYNDTNLWLKSNKNSVVLQGGGVSSLQARENGYLYYMTMKTGSGGSSLQVAGDGAFFIQTSATKYKEDIQYDGGTSIGDRFLTLDPATWQDKGDKEQRDLFHKTGEEPNHIINMNDKRYYGLIAEDLVKAGLEEFVVRDEVTGEVNGLEYDKVAISLIPVVREQRNALNELRVEIERLKDKING